MNILEKKVAAAMIEIKSRGALLSDATAFVDAAEVIKALLVSNPEGEDGEMLRRGLPLTPSFLEHFGLVRDGDEFRWTR